MSNQLEDSPGEGRAQLTGLASLHDHRTPGLPWAPPVLGSTPFTEEAQRVMSGNQTVNEARGTASPG